MVHPLDFQHACVRRRNGLRRVIVMNRRVTTLSAVVVVTFALLDAFAQAYARSCEDIDSLKLPNTTLVSATEIPARQFTVPKGPGADMQGPSPLERTAPTILHAF